MKKIFRMIMFATIISTLLVGCKDKTQEQTTTENELVNETDSYLEETSELSTEKSEVAEETTSAEETIDTEDITSFEETTKTEENTKIEETTKKDDTIQKEEETGEEDKISDDGNLGLNEYDENNFSNKNNNSSSVETTAKNIIAKIITKGMSDFDKAKAIHDYMVINIDYDYDDYLANTIPYESYNIEGALLNKYAVCAGYAKTFKYLCEFAGLECTYVVGYARGYHAWNQVKIDGKWYNVDVTWDDPVNLDKAFDDHKYNKYEYFLVSDAEFANHKPTWTVEKCDSSLRNKAYEAGMPWMENVTVKDATGIQTIIEKAIADNVASIMLIWDTEWLTMDEMKEEIKSAFYKELIAPDYKFVSYTYIKYEGTTLIRVTYHLELANGKYSKLNICDTVEELQAEMTKDSYWEHWIYYSTKMNNDGSIIKAMTNAFDQNNMCVDLVQETCFNDVVSAIKINSYKRNTDYVNADKGYSIDEVEELVKEYAKDYSETAKYISYYCKNYNDFATSYDKITDAVNEWKDEYCVCFENVETATDIGRYTFCIFEDVHTYGGWIELQKASCIKPEIWVNNCEKCGYELLRNENPANGVHDSYWVYIDDNNRQLKCHECSFEGKVETKYGDVWGYYDTEQAADLFNNINQKRQTSIYYEVDYQGNVINAQTPSAFVENKKLTQQAMEELLIIASCDMENFTVTNPLFWCMNYSDSRYIVNNWFMSSSTYYSLIDINRDEIGVACFYYDQDGTGLDLIPLWYVILGGNE